MRAHISSNITVAMSSQMLLLLEKEEDRKQCAKIVDNLCSMIERFLTLDNPAAAYASMVALSACVFVDKPFVHDIALSYAVVLASAASRIDSLFNMLRTPGKEGFLISKLLSCLTGDSQYNITDQDVQLIPELSLLADSSEARTQVDLTGRILDEKKTRLKNIIKQFQGPDAKDALECERASWEVLIGAGGNVPPLLDLRPQESVSRFCRYMDISRVMRRLNAPPGSSGTGVAASAAAAGGGAGAAPAAAGAAPAAAGADPAVPPIAVGVEQASVFASKNDTNESNLIKSIGKSAINKTVLSTKFRNTTFRYCNLQEGV